MKSQLLQHLRSLEEAQLYQALYTDSLTGLLNRHAFEQDASRTAVAIVDVDSLKYVNDTQGHRQGDALLKRVSSALVTEFGVDDVYRLHGDELAVKGLSAVGLQARLRALASRLPYFSHGVGIGLLQADARLNRCKTDRLQRGLRAPRGERPFWLGLEGVC